MRATVPASLPVVARAPSRPLPEPVVEARSAEVATPWPGPPDVLRTATATRTALVRAAAARTTTTRAAAATGAAGGRRGCGSNHLGGVVRGFGVDAVAPHGCTLDDLLAGEIWRHTGFDRN